MQKFSSDRFLNGLATAIPTILGDTVELDVEETARGEESHPIVTQGVTVLVGVLGDVEGYVLLSMSPDFAMRYTASLLGIEVKTYDEMVDSAIGELGNMITGQASMLLHRQGVDCDLCPPTILLSEKVELGGQAARIHGLSFQSDWGPIQARIAIGQPLGSTRFAHGGSGDSTTATPTLSKILESDQFLDELQDLFSRGDINTGLNRVMRLHELQFAIAPRLPPFLIDQAEGMRTENPEGALELAQTALGLDGNLRAGHLYLGRHYRQKKELERSLEHYLKALGLGAGEGDTYYWIGEIKHLLGDEEGARKVLALAMKHSATEPAGELLEKLGGPLEA